MAPLRAENESVLDLERGSAIVLILALLLQSAILFYKHVLRYYVLKQYFVQKDQQGELFTYIWKI